MLLTFRRSISFSSVTTSASLSSYNTHFTTTTNLSFYNNHVSMIRTSTTSSSTSMAAASCHLIPGLSPAEIDRIADQTFERYSSALLGGKKRGGGVSIVWFRNDLRVLDNEALFNAWISSSSILPVYCFDPRIFSSDTHLFSFPKTGALRAQFLIECVTDLKKNLMKRGINLLIKHGKPEDILPSLVKTYGVHTVYAHKETCSEELNVERLLERRLRQVVPSSIEGKSSNPTVKLKLIWGSTMYHIDDLPFNSTCLPDVYTQFRKAVEYKSKIRGCIKIPTLLGPAPCIDDWGHIPAISELGLTKEKVSKGLMFTGGESAALTRVDEYFWNKDLLCTYKQTRNGMLGPDYSTKFSPWLASGSLSPRFIYEEGSVRVNMEGLLQVSVYQARQFHFPSRKFEASYNLVVECLFPGGPRKVESSWSQDPVLFQAWKDGCTGYPLIDANMKELSTTGFMSNRGRQIVCSFLVRDMGIDWRMGAEWFETCLLDYDPCSNYGNWVYGAGVGNDPREDRYFSIPKQAQSYDPNGEYVAYWVPELRSLPKEKRNFPGQSYIKPIVALKYGNKNMTSGKPMLVGRRRAKLEKDNQRT